MGKNTPEGCQKNKVAGIQDLHSRTRELAVKRLGGDSTTTFKGKQREDGTTLLEAESETTSATTSGQTLECRLLRDAVETKIFTKYNPRLPHLASMLALH